MNSVKIVFSTKSAVSNNNCKNSRFKESLRGVTDQVSKEVSESQNPAKLFSSLNSFYLNEVTVSVSSLREIVRFIPNFLMILTLAACGLGSDSDLQHKIGSQKDQNLVSKTLQRKFALRINLKSNRLSYLNDGVVIAQWNIASGDVTGKYHSGVPQYTPPGVYTVHEMIYCPEWLPSNPFDPATGRETTTEEARWKVINSNPRIYGACGSANPLGQYVMWFNGPYGIHGNANESVLSLPSSDQRRVSGGCVRNPNQKIKWLFHDILSKSGAYPDYRKRVLGMEQIASKSSVSGSVSGLGIVVVVDYFDRDPAVGENISSEIPAPSEMPIGTNKPSTDQRPQNDSKPTTVASRPSDGQSTFKLCQVTYTEKNGTTSVYSKLPAIDANKIRQIKMGDLEKVYGSDGDFYKLTDGWILKSRLGQCKTQS